MAQLSRRSFLQKSAVGGLFMGLSAKSYRATFAAVPPSEQVRIGMIGVGNQGGPKNNMKYFLNNIVALCDLDQNYLGEAAGFLDQQIGRKAVMTDDYRRLLDSRDIDAVVVTVPDQWHALMTIEACQAGKDVYCEKPLTLVVNEGKPMIAAARKHKRVVQTGTMQRSGEEFKLAVRLVQEGLLGKISSVNVTLPGPNWIARAGKPVPDSAPPEGFDFNRWLGPAPLRPYNQNRVHYLFRFFWDYSGGQQTNFGAHHLDIAQWGLGMDDSGPVTVEGSAVYNPDGWYETPDSTDIVYTYSNGVRLNCRQKPGTPSKEQGTEFVGEKGSLFVYRGGLIANPPELLKEVEVPRIVNSDANFAHVQNFIDCIKSRETPAADISIGHRSATVCHLGNIAVRTNKKINWDPHSETIVGDTEASEWLTKEYRKPWTLA
ncbi:Gfo/Idh/MocA family protein [Rubinisphaera margarita]|uniref:Gfo/Idh/MocA family protein n=1 Tax=Rubinisphaera margarita TaxID=2909586 RepID=UPI001EE831F5|nr:Gfo/Idh/MocA family oxidoreductase [Rubinisphaera margarita]MCG6156571.1 Gfo/Idh/MocA family oxidoreductase [Rubinisphaera margarita]